VSIRLRLTLMYVGLLVGGSAAVLSLSWWLVDRHLTRTLPGTDLDGVLGGLATDYVLAVAGSALIALGLGWAAAGRALAPVREIARTAQRISQERLDARVRLAGPADELHDLADAFDAMLDRVQSSVDAQRRFVANASHELRTPLTVIRTEAEVALDDAETSTEDLREVLRSAVETTERTEALLDGLLLLALSTRGARRDDDVDLRAVAERVVTASRPEALARATAVRPLLRPAHVRGDEALLERLVGNLVENATASGRRR
jgi:signal transduction histidine kinase